MAYNIDNPTPEEEKRFHAFLDLSLDVQKHLKEEKGIDLSFVEAAELTMMLIENLAKAEDAANNPADPGRYINNDTEEYRIYDDTFGLPHDE